MLLKRTGYCACDPAPLERNVMALLKREPFAPVRSLAELFALAHGMEREAAERYGELAERMRSLGNPKLAAAFERLAADERRHVESVAGLSIAETGSPPQPSQVRWPPPETLDFEGVDAAAPPLVTEYRVLSVAVRNEERAFTFWAYVAAQADSAAVREAAERMARIELEHVALLRRRRRRAYHLEERKRARAVAPENRILERRLADECERRARETEGDVSAKLAEIAAEARRTADDLEDAGLPQPTGATAAPTDGLLPLAEVLVDRYLEAAELAKEEATVARAQSLAEAAIARLTWLRSLPPLSG
jgi:rubrerythrin